MTHSIETIYKFLDCLQDHQPLCVSKLSIKCAMTNQTALILKEKLLVTGSLRVSTPDLRREDMHITDKGKELRNLLEEILKA